jgi:hypothetical protein
MHSRRRSPSPRYRRSRRDRSPSYRRRRDHRSPSDRRRRTRYDSPPKEEALIANLHGLTDEAGTYRKMKELTAVAEAGAASARAEQVRQAKELYVGNLPPGMAVFTLIDRLNDVLVEMGATTMPGKPIVSGWLGGEGQFAFLQVRTVDECNNALSLNGYNLDGFQLKVGRPKGATGALTYTAPSTLTHGPATQFSLDEMAGLGLVVQPPLEESTKVETLVLVGAPVHADTGVFIRILENESNGEIEKYEEFIASKINRKSIVFEFKDVKHQRVISGKYLAFDRDYPLAVVRQDEAIAAGFINLREEQFTSWTKRPLASRFLWMCNFPDIQTGLEAEFSREIRETCSTFGTVVSIKVLNVNRDSISVPLLTPEKEIIVAVIEFESVSAACLCKRYTKGASVFFLPETSDLEHFSPNEEDALPFTPSEESLESYPAPLIRNGKIVSVEKSIIEEHKAKRRHKPAPEELEVID